MTSYVTFESRRKCPESMPAAWCFGHGWSSDSEIMILWKVNSGAISGLHCLKLFSQWNKSQKCEPHTWLAVWCACSRFITLLWFLAVHFVFKKREKKETCGIWQFILQKWGSSSVILEVTMCLLNSQYLWCSQPTLSSLLSLMEFHVYVDLGGFFQLS